MKNDISKNLYNLRISKGFTQEELAARLSVTMDTVAEWEAGTVAPTTDELIELSGLYNVSVDELLMLSNNSQEQPDVSFKSGIHVHNGREDVDISRDGIHIRTENGERVDMNKEELHKHINDRISHSVKGSKLKIWANALVPILAAIFYLLVGFFTERGWYTGWLVFLLIPIINSNITAVEKRKPENYSYPVFAVFTYVFIGLFFSIWHPTWLIFLTIPAYYSICTAFRKSSESRNKGTVYYSPYGNDAEADKRPASIGVKIFLAIICIATTLCCVSLVGAFAINSNAVGIGSSIASTVNTFTYKNDSEYSVGCSEVDLTNNLEIDWVNGSVQLVEYDGDKIKFEEPTQNDDFYTLRYLVSDNTLHIKFCKSGQNIGRSLSKLNKQLVVYVPKGYSFNEVDITTVSAPVNIQSITASNLDVEYVSGNISVNGAFNTLEFEGVSGDMNLYNTLPVFKCDIETISGDCKINLPENVSGYTCSYETVSGKFSGYDGFTSTKSFNNVSHSTGDGSVNVSFEGVSGNLDITK